MLNQLKFHEVVKKTFPILEQYVPVVDRVHGEHHPEFHEVRRIFNIIVNKIEESRSSDLKFELNQLRKITNHFTVPDDVCETYEAVYIMLKEIDDAYHS
jgi:iron-sulfur cluster repair protein YtfE (RIC family)